jgi:hypothetical protein
VHCPCSYTDHIHSPCLVACLPHLTKLARHQEKISYKQSYKASPYNSKRYNLLLHKPSHNLKPIHQQWIKSIMHVHGNDGPRRAASSMALKSKAAETAGSRTPPCYTEFINKNMFVRSNQWNHMPAECVWQISFDSQIQIQSVIWRFQKQKWMSIDNYISF